MSLWENTFLSGFETMNLVSKGLINIKESIKLWPNPAGHSLYIKNTGKQTFTCIYDKLGQRVMTFNLKNGLNKITIGQLSPGIYFLKKMQLNAFVLHHFHYVFVIIKQS